MNITVSQIHRRQDGSRHWSIYLALSLCMHALMACGLIQVQSSNIASPKPITITFELEHPIQPISQVKPKPQVTHQPNAQKYKERVKSQVLRAHPAAPAKMAQVPLKQFRSVISTPVSNLVQHTVRMPESQTISIPTFSAPSTVSEMTSETRSEPNTVAPTKPIVSTAIETPQKMRSIAKATWQGSLLGRLERCKHYPKAARELRQEGTAYLRFSMDREGKVLSAHLQKSTGSNLLDEETLKMVRRAEPLPAPPSEVSGNVIELVVPVQFSLKK